ncbi:MAG: class I SAM-dependent methyltransferase [Chloracidobacterium sp.]|nr:class I SAM-dependent methyltransferase [Chloracidobacterium sp.]
MSHPDPSPIWQIMTGFQQSAAYKTAIELEMFTKIAEGHKTAAGIAEACGAAERGIRILADVFTVHGFLTKTGNEYGLSEMAAVFLDRNQQTYLGSTVEFLMSEGQVRGYDDLTNAVRAGGSRIQGEASMDPDSPMWVTFAKAMMPMMVPSAMAIASNLGYKQDTKLKVLDIAAGHGIFGITIAQQFPNAEIVAVDWANVLTVATQNANQMGVGDRHHLIEGNAFDVDFGDGYDVVLVTNFLHHFDAETCTVFMKKVNTALRPDGKAITLEFIPNDDRVSPPAEALFSLVMLAATPAGDAYTFKELTIIFEDAGFSKNLQIPLPPTPQHLVISEK